MLRQNILFAQETYQIKNCPAAFSSFYLNAERNRRYSFLRF